MIYSSVGKCYGVIAEGTSENAGLRKLVPRRIYK